jgi:hypothetical protein
LGRVGGTTGSTAVPFYPSVNQLLAGGFVSKISY